MSSIIWINPLTLKGNGLLIDKLSKMCYNIGLVRREYKMDVKQKIQACLAEIDALLLEAKCDGELVHNLQCFEDLDESLNILQGYVEYYLD